MGVFRFLATLAAVFVALVALSQWTMLTDLQHSLPVPAAFSIDRRADETFPVPAEASMSTVDIIHLRGYPVEVHHVTTQDGYILELHRIPTSPKSQLTGPGRRAVFLQHGIFASDFVWVTAKTENALAFQLADRGYDVWLGNSRGNTYSRKHVTLDPDSLEYWDFSWDEMAKFDLPDSFEYVREVTGQSKLIYGGYSLGCTLFFASMAQDPQLNDGIEVMFGLGPTGTIVNLNNSFRFIAPLDTPLQFLLRALGTRGFLPADGLASRFLRFMCASSRLGAAIGLQIMYQAFGYSETLDPPLLHVLIGHYPAGGSARTVSQFFENYNSGGRLTRFNYGAAGNLQHYGTETAPEYDLSLVTAPVYLFWGPADPVVPPQDVALLASKLGNLGGSIRVNSDDFSHGDFFMSKRADDLVNGPVMDVIPPPLTAAST